MGLTANELTWETGFEGSNPSLSATFFIARARLISASSLIMDFGRVAE